MGGLPLKEGYGGVVPERSSVLLDEMKVRRSQSKLEEFRADGLDADGLDADADKLRLPLDESAGGIGVEAG